MKLIVGLGNIGDKYKNNRHNAGFRVIDLFANEHNISFNQSKFNGVFYKGDGFILAKPHTFMNLSGDFVQEITHFFKINSDDILVIYDDMDMELGKLRVRKNGTSGGQNGMKDVMMKMNTLDIMRLKIGIGKPKHHAVNHVLTDFKDEEWDVIKDKKQEIFKIINDFINS